MKFTHVASSLHVAARKENTASLLFKKTYMLKPAGVKMVSRVDLGVLDNIKSAYMKNCYMGSQKIEGKTGTLLAIAY